MCPVNFIPTYDDAAAAAAAAPVVEESRAERFRSKADEGWRRFRNADNVWSHGRLRGLMLYSSYLTEHEAVLFKKDFKKLKKTLDCPEEPKIIRAVAATILAGWYSDFKRIDSVDLDQAAEYSRQSIELCDTATPEEKGRLAYYEEANKNKPLQGLFDQLREGAVCLLTVAENKQELTPVDSVNPVDVNDFVRTPWDVLKRDWYVPVFGKVPTEHIERRLAAGGATCDCCGATEGTGGGSTTSLRVCEGCKRAYYCSKKCQKQQWKVRGHRKACKKPRVFQAGDIVRFHIEKSKNIGVARLIYKTIYDDDVQWETISGMDPKTGMGLGLALSESKLQHVRPADVVQQFHSFP